jgi:nucleoid DNA-binding protein
MIVYENDLINDIEQDTRLSKKFIKEIVTAYQNAIVQNVSKGHTVRIIGFGSFEKTEGKAANLRNFQTGEELGPSTYSYVRFRSGSDLKKKVRKTRR